MGLGGISIWQLVIVLVIVILIFGTKKLKGMGSDLGGAVKSFKGAIKDNEAPEEDAKKIEDEANEDIANTQTKESVEQTTQQSSDK